MDWTDLSNAMQCLWSVAGLWDQWLVGRLQPASSECLSDRSYFDLRSLCGRGTLAS